MTVGSSGRGRATTALHHCVCLSVCPPECVLQRALDGEGDGAEEALHGRAGIRHGGHLGESGRVQVGGAVVWSDVPRTGVEGRGAS